MKIGAKFWMMQEWDVWFDCAEYTIKSTVLIFGL